MGVVALAVMLSAALSDAARAAPSPSPTAPSPSTQVFSEALTAAKSLNATPVDEQVLLNGVLLKSGG